jgi:FkbM family methyltransferase
MKNYNLIIILFCIILLFFLHWKKSFECFNYTKETNNLRLIPFYDENNKKINIDEFETEEQEQADQYIEKDDIVLELGGRYGTVSCIINNKLKNKTNHLVIEPDNNVINALTKNRDLHKCKFEIFNGYVGEKQKCLELSGYGTRLIDCEKNDSNIKFKTLEELMNKYNFNCLVADCEGCLGEIFEKNLTLIPKFKKIIYEKDVPDATDYERISFILKKLGFKQLNKEEDFRPVWIKI